MTEGTSSVDDVGGMAREMRSVDSGKFVLHIWRSGTQPARLTALTFRQCDNPTDPVLRFVSVTGTCRRGFERKHVSRRFHDLIH
jgi:hypothetical protein